MTRRLAIAAALALSLSTPPALAALGSSTAHLALTEERPGGQVEIVGLNPSLSSPASLSDISQSSLIGAVPILHRTDDQATLLLRGGRTLLPHSTATFWDLGAGASFNHKLPDGNSYGLNFLVGSPSDQPFARFRDVTIQSNIFYRLATHRAYGPDPGPASGQSSAISRTWIFAVNYSNNRPFLNGIPIPGIAYSIQQKGRFGVVAGIPFFTAFARLNRFGVFGMLAPWNVRAQIGYSLMGPFQVYGSYSREYETFLPADRLNDATRLFYDERRLALGLMAPLSRQIMLDLSGGKSFSRRAFEAERFSGQALGARLLDPSYFFFLKAKLLFG